MNILHIRSQYVVDGGVETFLNALIARTEGSRFCNSVALLTTKEIQRTGFCEAAFKVKGRRGGYYRVEWDKKRALVGTTKRVVEIIKQRDIDLLHTHDNRSNIAAFLAKKVMRGNVAWVASGHGWVTKPWKSRMIGNFDKLLIRSADLVHFCSTCLFGQIRTMPKGRIVAVPYFLDVPDHAEAYDPRRVRRQWNIPEHCVVLGVLGRLGPEKGHVYLLSAFADVVMEFPDTRLVVVGDGPLRTDLQRLARRLGLEKHVVFTGFVRDAMEACSGLDVVVQSSLSETLSMVLMEASYLGKPIVATDVGASRAQIVPGRNGYLVPPGNSEALAASMKRMVAEKGQFQRFGAASRELGKRFSSTVVTLQYQELYERLYREQTNKDRSGTHPE